MNKKPKDKSQKPIDLKKVIKFIKENWYWINPVLKQGYEYLSNAIKKLKRKKSNKSNINKPKN